MMKVNLGILKKCQSQVLSSLELKDLLVATTDPNTGKTRYHVDYDDQDGIKF